MEMDDPKLLSKNRIPFSHFAPPIRVQSELRKAITAAHRRPETLCVPPLVTAASLPAPMRLAVSQTARKLVAALRAKHKGTGVEDLVQEYALSSQEGVALMCLAEALLRIPDTATRSALIRDKIAKGDWRSHIGADRSLFVNAATWGLVVTGKLTATVNDRGLAASLTRMIGQYGEPVIRRAVDMAMRMMGEQFVMGETIELGLRRAHSNENAGYLYSYDMLGEAATTAADAERFYSAYETAIHFIGKAAGARGIYNGPGISIKLSALHPRYCRAQSRRVMSELLPRLKLLARLAKGYNIGFNIDAEEADRLELSLDLLESLSLDSELANWNGLGFVVQAYSKRCPYVLDFIIDLARRSQRRIMVRLVKGAYWDSEIKRAQVDGLEDYPVFTRKIYTDVSYLAGAQKLLNASDFIFPQFATHNAQTVAAIYHMAGAEFKIGDYEFQCLHGMGEPLYSEVVGSDKLNRPCRIYAPIGTHETLLAYLVRRLLENGANSSFVHRISDPEVSVEDLVSDPVEAVRAMRVEGEPNLHIALPSAMFGAERQNSRGIDLSNEASLNALATALTATNKIEWKAAPILVQLKPGGLTRPILNSANHYDIVGQVTEADVDDATLAAKIACDFAKQWQKVNVSKRASMLERAADLMQSRIETLMGLAMREAGKTAASALGEVREAVDFLRYYAAQARKTFNATQKPLGVVVCISPWNFPLAIFTGQVAAALAAGNCVLAKPAEETPLIAFEAVQILHEAGVPLGALQFLPGNGKLGEALVAAPQTDGVMFTGSTEVARLIQSQLAQRLSATGKPIVLIAETGGQNAMIVDSSALTEQVVGDVVASAFDSAGQRCSALRIVFLQEEIADRTLVMLKGAFKELTIGNPDRLDVDIGPVIHAEAKSEIERHIEKLRLSGCEVTQLSLPAETVSGTFVAPTIIEIKNLSLLQREVFGPVLHVMRYRRDDLLQLLDEINATGYGLTFGLHTRLDETIALVTQRIRCGNLYVNRNMIGAVVGVQPFGGRGLSGTGPKAGGPLYLQRLVEVPPRLKPPMASQTSSDTMAFVNWLETKDQLSAAKAIRAMVEEVAVGVVTELSGPVGEANLYSLHPRGRILIAPQSETGLFHQLGAVLATGNEAVIDASRELQRVLKNLPDRVAAHLQYTDDWQAAEPFAGALIEGDAQRVKTYNQKIAALPGPLVLVQAAKFVDFVEDGRAYCLNWLMEEVSTSINTTAAGGNASLMSIS